MCNSEEINNQQRYHHVFAICQSALLACLRCNTSSTTECGADEGARAEVHAAVVEASSRAATALATAIAAQAELPGRAVQLHGSLLVDRLLTFYFPGGPQQVQADSGHLSCVSCMIVSQMMVEMPCSSKLSADHAAIAPQQSLERCLFSKVCHASHSEKCI